jgi:hypothetical protein
MVHVGIARYDDDVALLPPQRVHFGAGSGQKGRRGGSARLPTGRRFTGGRRFMTEKQGAGGLHRGEYKPALLQKPASGKSLHHPKSTGM